MSGKPMSGKPITGKRKSIGTDADTQSADKADKANKSDKRQKTCEPTPIHSQAATALTTPLNANAQRPNEKESSIKKNDDFAPLPLPPLPPLVVPLPLPPLPSPTAGAAMAGSPFGPTATSPASGADSAPKKSPDFATAASSCGTPPASALGVLPPAASGSTVATSGTSPVLSPTKLSWLGAPLPTPINCSAARFISAGVQRLKVVMGPSVTAGTVANGLFHPDGKRMIKDDRVRDDRSAYQFKSADGVEWCVTTEGRDVLLKSTSSKFTSVIAGSAQFHVFAWKSTVALDCFAYTFNADIDPHRNRETGVWLRIRIEPDLSRPGSKYLPITPDGYIVFSIKSQCTDFTLIHPLNEHSLGNGGLPKILDLTELTLNRSKNCDKTLKLVVYGAPKILLPEEQCKTCDPLVLLPQYSTASTNYVRSSPDAWSRSERVVNEWIKKENGEIVLTLSKLSHMTLKVLNYWMIAGEWPTVWLEKEQAVYCWTQLFEFGLDYGFPTLTSAAFTRLYQAKTLIPKDKDHAKHHDKDVFKLCRKYKNDPKWGPHISSLFVKLTALHTTQVLQWSTENDNNTPPQQRPTTAAAAPMDKTK